MTTNNTNNVTNNDKSLKVFGSVFIVPNRELFGRYTTGNVAEVVGSDFQIGDRIIELWVQSEGSSNWSCHGIPVDLRCELSKAGFSKEDMPDYFNTFVHPRVLEDVKEGDIIPITLNVQGARKGAPTYTFGLLARQKGSRYERFGVFEEVLGKML